VKEGTDSIQERLDFALNELRLVKEVNSNFRQENNKLVSEHEGMQAKIDELKGQTFHLNEVSIEF